MLEALGYREQGYSFAQIAGHMKCSQSVVHTWIVQLLQEVPTENVKEVRRLELARLDQMHSAHYEHATEGDIAATAMCLRIADQRAKLLGLYPKEGTQVLIAPPGGGEKAANSTVNVVFVLPGNGSGRALSQEAMAEVVPEPVKYDPAPPGQLALPKPSERPFDMWRDVNGRWRTGRTE
jgi:hypothetical protein